MSFSINHSPSINSDTLPLDLTVSKEPSVGKPVGLHGAGLGHTPSAPRTEFSTALQRDGLNNANMLTKLFDMFEQLVSALREMFSGKAETVALMPHTDTTANTTQGIYPQNDVAVHTQPLLKDAAAAASQLKGKLQTGSLSKVISDVADQLKETSDEDSHPAAQPVLGSRVSHPMRESGMSVTNQAKPQVKVEVNINHCHCPETLVERDGITTGVSVPVDHRPRTRINLKPDSPAEPHPTVGETLKTVSPITPVAPAPIDDHDHDHDSHSKPRHIHSEVPGSPRKTPQEDLEVLTKPKVGVTSPGPAENENDRWDQGFSSRSRLRN